MKYRMEKEQLGSLEKSEKTCFLLTNGLGGFSGLSVSGGLARGDQSLLMAAIKAPNVRWNMVLSSFDEVIIDQCRYTISSQRMLDEENDYEGHKYLTAFEYENYPEYIYEIDDVLITKSIIMVYGENTTIVKYSIENPKNKEVEITVTPIFKLAAKNDSFNPDKHIDYKLVGENCLKINCFSEQINRAVELNVCSDGKIHTFEQMSSQTMSFALDARDGRNPYGAGAMLMRAGKRMAKVDTMTLVYTTNPESAFVDDIVNAFDTERKSLCERNEELINKSGLKSELGKALVTASDAFVVNRESTNGKTIIAGYPFFEDWGRDTMIALAGTTLVTKRYDDCKNILRTFAKYAKNGLLPNLFPEGDASPMYNSVDAPLLYINSVYEYVQTTKDYAFADEVYDVLKETVDAYYNGSDYGIHCDEDGLVAAGEGKWQLTWMDVCVEGILPTPRHGKPVEINAYWYSALRCMSEFAAILHKKDDFSELADRAKDSFRQKFVNEAGGLKDVLSGTNEENQIRPNQIWALTMPFTVLDDEMYDSVIDIVADKLYTTVGLRTLNKEDPEFKGIYIGPMKQRDLAYHQGTVWTFPLGAFLRARIRRLSRLDEAAYSEETVFLQKAFHELEHWMSEGCVNQLAEIYDGDEPTESRGCFAQAWSVAEILRAVNDWEQINN